MKLFNIEILALAREARGLTQVELSKLLNVEQGTISKVENGKISISQEVEEKLPEILNFPEDIFYQDKRVVKVAGHYRKKVSLPMKKLKEYTGKMTFTEWHINKLCDAVDIPVPNIPSWDIDKDGTAAEAAQYLREYWRIPRGRIDDLASVMEDNGIVIAPLLLGDMDALSTYSAEYRIPITYINKSRPADRIRFSLAHELCHYVCHFGNKITDDSTKRDIEREADIFASELLVPAREILPQLNGRIDMQKLGDLKLYWKVSMQAILSKAKAIGAINANQSTSLWKQLSMLGYRTKEPIEIPSDNISLLKELIETHVREMGYSKEDLAQLLHVTSEELEELYFNARPKLKLQIVRKNV